MELKLTTLRALEYEKRTGKDIVVFLKEVAESNIITVREAVDLFIAMGDGYTADDFDKWDVPYNEKLTLLMGAVKDYIAGKK